ncbi:hypothetical protein [Kitasatospora herbaricolor]|uniref:RDD family protein n=1 Tax=Kitasatospora herbaricolor TaxID=68217 RepID=A0ABZ1WGG0_9ACTN|nr:hypothetical protein [Kitasatospora herbaricolor]
MPLGGATVARVVLDILTALALLPIAATVAWALHGRIPPSAGDLLYIGGIVLPLTAQVIMHLPSVRSAYRRGTAGR